MTAVVSATTAIPRQTARFMVAVRMIAAAATLRQAKNEPPRYGAGGVASGLGNVACSGTTLI
jgi:hypothetical protein